MWRVQREISRAMLKLMKTCSVPTLWDLLADFWFLFVCCDAGFYFEYLTSLFWSFVFRSWCLYSSLWFYQRIGKWTTIPYMSWIGTEVALTSLTLYLIRRTTVLQRTPIIKTARRLWVTFIICTRLIFPPLCFWFFETWKCLVSFVFLQISR